MDRLVVFLNDSGAVFCRYAGAMFVQTAVLVAVLLLVDLLIRKRVRAAFRYWMWMLVFVKLLLPPTLALPTGAGYWLAVEAPAVERVAEGPLPVVVPPPVYAPTSPPVAVPVTVLPTPREPMEVLPVPDTSPEAVAPMVAGPTLAWQAGPFVLWLAGLVVFGLLLVQRAFFVSGLIAQSEPADGDLTETLERCARQIGVRRRIGLRVSPNTFSPAVCGLFRPVILLPASLLGKLSRESLRAVLIHELAHIKRGDLWLNFAQTLLQVVYFYNPLVWLAGVIVRRIREQAVDEMVLVALGAEAKSYSRTLIDIAEMTFFRANPALRLIGVAESKKSLEGRIKHMLTRPIPKSAKVGFWGLVALTLTAAVLLPMARARSVDGPSADTGVSERGQELDTLEGTHPANVGKDLIQGRVLDPNGSPIAGVIVRIDRDVSFYYPPVTTETDEQGRYSLPVPRWPYRILAQWQDRFASEQGHRRQLMQLKRVFEGPQTVNFRFDRFPQAKTIITGKIVDSDDNPVTDFTVWLCEVNDIEDPNDAYRRKRDYLYEIRSEKGTFEVHGLPAREYSVRIRPLSRRLEATNMNIVLEDIQTKDCSAQLAVKKTFYGRVVFGDGSPAVLPDGQTQITIWRGSASSATLATLDDDGFFELHLSEGDVQEIKANDGQLPILLKGYYRGIFPFDRLTGRRANAQTVTIVRPETAPDSVAMLAGKPLPGFDEVGIGVPLNWAEGRMILACFFAVDQRPSRNCIVELNKRAQALARKGVVVVGVHASRIEQSSLDRWMQDNDIHFPIGMVEGNAAQARSDWGVNALPWLILTDRQHVVTAEGFSVDELDDKLAHIATELDQDQASARNLSGLGQALLIWANAHDDRFPDSMAVLGQDVEMGIPRSLPWLEANVVYLGRGMTIRDRSDRPLAYDRTLLEDVGGTNVLYLDSHVAFETQERLEKLGIWFEAVERVRTLSWMRVLALAAILYANNHEGNFADDLKALKPYVGDDGVFAWMLENTKYLGKGATLQVRDPAQTPLAYSVASGGAAVAFFDGHVEFVPHDRLEGLGILPASPTRPERDGVGEEVPLEWRGRSFLERQYHQMHQTTIERLKQTDIPQTVHGAIEHSRLFESQGHAGVVVAMTDFRSGDLRDVATSLVIDGRYSLGLLPAGIYHIILHQTPKTPGIWVHNVEVKADQPSVPVDFRFGDASVTVRVLDEQGMPLDTNDVELLIGGIATDTHTFKRATGIDNGLWQVEYLYPGEYGVHAIWRGRQIGDLHEIADGRNEVLLTFEHQEHQSAPPFHSLVRSLVRSIREAATAAPSGPRPD